MTGDLSRVASRDRIVAWGLLFLVGGVWGITFSLAKIATEAGIHPIALSWWQAVLGAGFAFTYSLISRNLPPVTSSSLVFYAMCGLLGTALPGTLFFYAAPEIAAGVISITVATVPMTTLLLSLPFGLDRMAPLRLLGIMLGVIAVVMMVAPETSLPGVGDAFWVFVCLVASGCYALENVWIALRRPDGCNSFGVLTGMLMAAVALLTPLMLFTGTFQPLNLPFGTIEWTIIAIAAINTLCYGLFIQLVTTAGPVFASQGGYLVTLSGVVWGIILFDESHSVWIWGALVIMMAGLALVQPR